jgi:hypothetical protein
MSDSSDEFFYKHVINTSSNEYDNDIEILAVLDDICKDNPHP